MKKRKMWIPLVLAGLIVLQGLAAPASRYARPQIFDDDTDSIDFTLWTRDSISVYADSLLNVDKPLIEDEFSFVEMRDSLLGRTVDSIFRAAFVRDSLIKDSIAFRHWFDSLPKREQKKWYIENVKIPQQIHKADSIQARKDSIQAVKDSITETTPRILETTFLPDSLYYKRILRMKQDIRFGDITVEKHDTSFNYWYYDYPFMREDVNGTWQGVAGSAVQPYTFHKRQEEENAIFFTPYRSWTYTPSSVPMYNTKTPYTELAYWGTLIAGKNKEEINLRLLTTQNITPALNITFELNKYGSGSQMMKQNNAVYNMGLTTNYLGKRYEMHAGWLHDKYTNTENGGFRDNMWIRDTTVDSREIEVNLAKAENIIQRNTLFINHSLRIPFGSDSLTTAFIGHTTEWNQYNKYYSDNITDDFGRRFYNNTFLINSGQSADTMKVMRLDNKLYLRLQPWKDDFFISKIDVGIGDKLLNHYDCLNDSTAYSRKVYQNNVYAYAGARGSAGRYFNWDAIGQLYFAGYQAGDFSVDANANVNFYPFRRHRKSPLSLGAHFHTDLTSPDYYEQRILTNHYRWDNNFKRKSTTRISATVDIPAWKLDAEVAYTMLANNIYYDTLSIVRQHEAPMSVISATLHKDFVIWKFHLDNRLSLQFSSDQAAVPVPLLALNLRYYFQFNVVKNILQMQIGANALFNTAWKMPGFNPNLGVFFNQNKETYGNCPYIDVFVNMQWKRACIFIKLENANQGWPKDYGKDYFSAHQYIHTQRVVKFGIYWPFYVVPSRIHHHDHGGEQMAGGAQGIRRHN